MPVIENILGWSVFGLVTRSFQLALQRRAQTDALHVTGGYAVGFGALGYYLYDVERAQKAQIERKKQALLESRARRAAQAEA